MTRPIYAIGDIHGQRSMLEDTLALIEADGGPEAPVVFLGDYIDRGPDSRGVLDLLSSGLAEGRNWTCLKGNHDRLMEWYLNTPPVHDPYLLVGFDWMHERIGGRETAASYGVTEITGRRMFDLADELRETVPDAHQRFLRHLQLSHRAGGLFFAHAGIRPGVPLDAQTETDLLWIRQEFHDDPRDHGALIVHGHTPVQSAEHHGNRVNLDSGAGYGRPITAAVFEAGKVWELGAQGRVALG
ncbi:serine/threonine protein phosphatase [Lutimaribacter sp. EGI FJ00015]|uniref:Serine/threonine protein phosphatase n=1 Tax=Lutimaribacter degradans TaxID=2945989 RepID=A0ACC5ZXN9_9RHOB|nr:metallophosphoesterase family protein [Lutimaribacter sp. EGI FJ00013]MCM2562831.1 serine/threonine protein phosphatase [Lutimaribacter sp. EGI FJ00013]MCO0613988.1 serine/threonine protein phosphatase [Lutimaribacter sp. EGI FJ00015]MCO0636960.1 serine/threonine protein phosphatase [Lutimaribacter sp. EGI FJ00014]